MWIKHGFFRNGGNGKTLTLNKTERFFSDRFAGQPDVFRDMEIADDEEMMKRQGTFPVISMTLMTVEGNCFEEFLIRMEQTVRGVFRDFRSLMDDPAAAEDDRRYLSRMITTDACRDGLRKEELVKALARLSQILEKSRQKKVIILLDEPDSPLHAAYLKGYYDEAVDFIRAFFKETFKKNRSMHRALLTGITRVSRESIFSDFNNASICSVMNDAYADIFGFTEKEVCDALTAYGMADRLQEVKDWYDGYVFGSQKNMFNPWSVSLYLEEGKPGAYWTNTSSNQLISRLIQTGSAELKRKFERLMADQAVACRILDDFTYAELEGSEQAIWSLMLSSGYLKTCSETHDDAEDDLLFLYNDAVYVKLVNREVREMLERRISEWFLVNQTDETYIGFLRGLLNNDTAQMEKNMQKMALTLMSSFDTASRENHSEPERFYHGFVLGLIASLSGRYVIHSNRESGLGRYDIMMEPSGARDAILIEFKVFDPKEEKSLEGTCQRALAQIEEKKYDQELIRRGIAEERIRKYGFGFRGKDVRILKG